MIVDAHVHLYPPEVAAQPAAWANARGERHWLECVQPPAGPRLQGWPSVDRLLRDMDAAGIDKALIQSWYWESHDTCDESLAWQVEWTRAHPERLMALAPFHARGGPGALDLLRRALDAGLVGIGEIHPPAQGYAYDDPFLDQALDLAAQARAPVSVHVTEPTGHVYPGRCDTPFMQLQALARRHPDTRFVFAHLGGLLPFHEQNAATRAALRNVWYDTSAVPLLYDRAVYPRICDVVEPSRILFGTDYPLRTFPKRQSEPSFQLHLDDIRASGLSSDQLHGILGQNFIDLIQGGKS